MLPVVENVNTIEELMDVIELPMFLLDVLGKEEFVFRRLNRCHQATTGMNDADLCGCRPHDVLPERLADTVVNNYETCRGSGEAYTYEEVLDLPNGTLWWQTTLSPVKDKSGQVLKIIGSAVDITDRKSEVFEASEASAQMARLNEDLQVFAVSTSRDMRGPLETMVALLELVREGFVDLGDEKSEQLTLCQEIAAGAISNMSSILDVAQSLKVRESVMERVDLYHIAADIAALLDPDNRLNMELPPVKLETDRVALQMVLRNVMSNAVRYADSSVDISVQEQHGMVAITVADDGVGQNNVLRCDGEAVLPGAGPSHQEFGLASAAAIVTSRGGEMVTAVPPYPTGAAIRFTLPGRVLDSV